VNGDRESLHLQRWFRRSACVVLFIMSVPRDFQRELGATGLAIPPILFGTAAFGNVPRVITDQARLAIISEWLRANRGSIFVEARYEHGDGVSLEVLGRMLRRLDISADEVIIQLTVVKDVSETWERCCRLLSDAYRPKLLALEGTDQHAWQAALDLKSSGRVRGVGIVASCGAAELKTSAAANPDWVTLACGPTVMQHGPELLATLAGLQKEQIPVISAGVFEGGFLVGRNQLDGRPLRPEDNADRSVLAWRKAFVALCDGHGISPAHACIQFALALPGIVAVRVESSYADRIAEDSHAAVTPVPENFWASLREEGLLSVDMPGS
jgi:D-threo-aldose 1-dehydrogenase